MPRMLQTYSSKRRYLDSWLNYHLFSTKNFWNRTIFGCFRNFDWFLVLGFYLNFHFFGDDFIRRSFNSLWSGFSYGYDVFVWISNCFWQNGTHLSGFQMFGLRDFKSHSKSRPFSTQPLFDHSKSRLVRISDPYCTMVRFMSKFCYFGPISEQLFKFGNIGQGGWNTEHIYANPGIRLDPVLG